MDNKAFLEAFDTMYKKSNGAVKVAITDLKRPGNGMREPKVFSRDGYVFWEISPEDSIEILAENLIKVESLIDQANAIRKYDEETRRNHPDLIIALKARVYKDDGLCL